MLRLNHFSRTFAEVPQELLPYCFVENDKFGLPPFPDLMAYKVIVTTCQGADVLVQARVTNRDLLALQDQLIGIISKDSGSAAASLHWTTLLIDEAAQATEPESLIPLTVVAPPANFPISLSPTFVMAGDEFQLGPRTYDRSTIMHISLFERLSKTHVYAAHPQARKNLSRTIRPIPMLRPPFVNLIRNYRSHPAILAVPSSLFYANTLIPEAHNTGSLQPWSSWRGRRWPVLFTCNAGIDDCEDVHSVGGGWFNSRETIKALDHARSLLASGVITDQSDICIMSPFSAQVNRLRQIARQTRLWNINIGPMEAFQGLEHRCVIICTTRARKRFLDEDKLRGIGIVNEPKMFNVALTRAKEGLIVIGNPQLLCTDPYWMAFMTFCWRNSLWQEEKYGGGFQPDYPECDVNAWKPSLATNDIDIARPSEISGLEAALVYRERDKEVGSRAARTFMRGHETQEDSLWRSGMEAQEEIDFAE